MLDAAQAQAGRIAANEAVRREPPVTVSFADTSQDLGLRKASERAGTLRVVDIAGRDRSACGGTHVRSSGEIGPVLIRASDKVRNTVRMEFLRACGPRAAPAPTMSPWRKSPRRSRRPLDDTPGLVSSAQLEALKIAAKDRRRLEDELGIWVRLPGALRRQ